MHIRLAYLLLCCAIYCTTGSAQPTPAFGTALPHAIAGTKVATIHSSIWCIYQDKKKNYWLGSNGGGVYKYDGKNITQYTTRDGLLSNQIRGIQEDKYGNLYFETIKTVTKFDGRQFTALTPVPAGIDQWQLQPDDLWFRGNGEIKGVYRYDGHTLHHLVCSSFQPGWDDAAHSIYSLYKDKQNNIWLGTLSAGVARFDGKTLKWIKEKELSVLQDGRVPAVRYILQDADGYYWLSNILSRYKLLPDKASSKWTLQYTKTTGIPTTQQHPPMLLPYCTSAIISGRHMWMTNYNEGVWRYDGNKLEQFRLSDGATQALVICIYKDAQDTLWVGTDNQGIYKYNGKEWKQFKF